MQERLVRVETKLDSFESKLDKLIATLEPRQLEHDARLRAVETSLAEVRVRIALVAGGTGTAGGLVASILALLVAR